MPLAELDAAVDALLSEILPNSGDAIAAYKALYNKGASANVLDAVKFEEKTEFEILDSADRLSEFIK